MCLFGERCASNDKEKTGKLCLILGHALSYFVVNGGQ
jgi:hypothetical protein